MDIDQIKQVLVVAMGYDNRNPGDLNAMAWGEAARRARWTFEEAVDAVHEHYAAVTTWIMPGHITAIIRAKRQDQAMRDQAAMLAIAPSPRVAELVADTLPDIDAELADREPLPPPSKYRHACPHCKAEAGTPCTRPSHGPKRVPLTGVHPARLNVEAS